MERSGAEKVIYGEANRGISILSIRSRCRPEKACRVKVLASIFDISCRRLIELFVGIGPGAALCGFAELRQVSFMALFCRQFGRWNHSTGHYGNWSGDTGSMGLVQTAGCFRVSRNVSYGIGSGCAHRICGAATHGTMAVRSEDAESAWYRRCPYRTNVSSSAAGIPDRGWFRSEEVTENIYV